MCLSNILARAVSTKHPMKSDNQFQKICKNQKAKIQSKLDAKKSKEAHKHPYVVLNDFCKYLTFSKNSLIKKYDPDNYKLNQHKFYPNLFMEELVESYTKHKEEYIDDAIVHFIREHVPNIRKHHQLSFNDKPQDYQFQPEFLHADDEAIVKLLAKYTAYNDFIYDLEQQLNPEEFSPSVKSKVTWKGSQTSFIQLIYGLEKAGLLKHESSSIDKLVSDLANYFNVDLSSHWKSDHSKSIHKTNLDYDPKIFDQIKKAYLTYREQQLKNKKKSSPT